MASLKIKILVAALLFPIISFASYTDYHLRIEDENYGDKIEFIGGRPMHILGCLLSDFGKGNKTQFKENAETANGGYEREWTKYEWNKVSNKEWNLFNCTLSFQWSIGIHPDYGFAEHFSIDSIAYSKITLVDVNGKNVLADSITRRNILKFVTGKLISKVFYINSDNGINVRKEPSLTSPVIHKLKDASFVVISEPTKKFDSIQADGKIVSSQWIKVIITPEVSGYVPEVFLLPSYKIHPKSLWEGAGIEGDNNTVSFSKRIQVELIESPKTEVPNPYKIDSRDISIKMVSPPGIMLPLNKGKDTLMIYDRDGEYYTETFDYIGRVPVYEKYIVYSEYFGNSYSMYSINSKDTSGFSINGIPYISPNGKYVIDFQETHDIECPDIPHSCLLSFTRIGKNLKEEEKITFTFFSWLPDETAGSAFWISDNELVIKVYSSLYEFVDSGAHPPEYIKLTIR